MIELGDEVKDRVTGFKGIATGRAVFLYGCTRISVTPKVKNGKAESEWFDEAGIERIGPGVNKPRRRPPGGPQHVMPIRSMKGARR
jgi:hypothetical protein